MVFEGSKMQAEKTIKICSVELCESLVRARGFCRKHYEQFKYLYVKKPRPPGTCIYPNCDKQMKIKMMCSRHYQNSLIYQRITSDDLLHMKCSVDDCVMRMHAKKLCKRHYEREKRIGSPLLSAKKRTRCNFTVDFSAEKLNYNNDMGTWFKKNNYSTD